VSAERESAAHPTIDRLEAWADRRLDAAAAALVERHFARCADCRQLAEDLRGFADPVDEAGDSQTETEASLGRLRLRILAEELAAGEGELGADGRDGAVIIPFVERPAPPPAVISPRHSRPALAWAAVALVAASGFGLAWQRQREVERLRLQPLLNITVVSAWPEDDPFRSGEEEEKSADVGTMVVVESSDLPFPDGAWRALIEDRNGEQLRDITGLKPQKGGKLRVVLPPGSGPPGRHRLRLFHDGTPWKTVYVVSLGDG
jgi:hypothetical protein